MTATANDLATRCGSVAETSTEAIRWFDDNAATVRQERTALVREFRRFGIGARRLMAAAGRPMCVGVFGPSQAGKSYLISALARREATPLIAVFDGIPDGVDFVREINPEGDEESTGLVTRFTIRRTPTPAGFPVALRLLSQTDIVKIIANTFLSDTDRSDDDPPAPERIATVLDELRSQAQPQPVDVLTADDVFDLQEYFETYFRGDAYTRALAAGFWADAIELAPRLPAPARAKLFALLWGEIEEFTGIYLELHQALSRLGFAADAYCPIDALLPRSKSIIHVRTLSGLGTGKGETLAIRSANGQEVVLPRSSITALTAELRIVMADKPWGFFEHTDLLDFPGARSRENIPDIRRFLRREENALYSLFLRGKVAYLYERYCAEQELTSMLLCIGPSNQEVRTLPAMIQDWIAGTHGATPEERARVQTALFLVLTKFDMAFIEKAGQSEQTQHRWSTRLNTSLLDFFGKTHAWPREWTPGRPFDNSFWLRNPNVKADHIVEYDEDGKEAALHSRKTDKFPVWRREYLETPAVREHVRNPERAWDEAFKLNDGGISYLAENLAPVCNPEIKVRQIEARLTNQARAMAERLARYHVSGSLDQELEKRRAACAALLRELARCVQAERFGHLLRALQVDEDTVARIHERLDAHAPTDGAVGAGSLVQPIDADDLLGDVLGDLFDEAPAAAEAPRAAPMDQAGRFADAVMQHWTQGLHGLADDGRMCGFFQMGESAMGELTAELIAGARRLDVPGDIARRVRQATAFRRKNDPLPVLIATNALNGFVNGLGFDRMAPEKRPTVGKEGRRRPVFAPRPCADGPLVLPDQPTRFEQAAAADWMAGLRQLVDDNVMSQDGSAIDLAQNRRIGQLIAALRTAG